MTTAQLASKANRASSRSAAKAPARLAATNPPQIIPQLPAAAHPVYGATTVTGIDDLAKQSIFVLNRWHEKAIKLSDEYWSRPGDKPDIDPEYNPIYEAKWDLFEAAFSIEIVSSDELAALLSLINRQVEDSGDTDFINKKRVSFLNAAAQRAARRPQPTKSLPALHRGRKLTKTGQLFRYQSFLVQELLTVGNLLYGAPYHPLRMIHIDHEVTKRCSSLFRNGKLRTDRRTRKIHPFFDERALPARALTVLSSLKINTTDAGELADRPLRKGR